MSFNNKTRQHSTIILPESNIIESGYLESMLKNLSTSYKLFWFRAIFYEILKGERRMEYRTLVARMIASAWYPVVFYRLSMGKSDKLSETISYIQEHLPIHREEKEERIVELILESEDRKLKQKMENFIRFVPFRLIRPFYQSEIAEIVQTGFSQLQKNGRII